MTKCIDMNSYLSPKAQVVKGYNINSNIIM